MWKEGSAGECIVRSSLLLKKAIEKESSAGESAMEKKASAKQNPKKYI